MNVENGIQIDDLMAIARRRAKVAIGVALTIAMLGFWVVMALPNQYQSYATVLIEPQTVDPELVESGVGATDLNQRLGIMASQILSRSRLSRIIDDLSLYQSEQEDMVRQEVIDLMRSRVSVEPIVPELGGQTGNRGAQDFEINTFRIVFNDRDAVIAKLVAERLANDFIESHIEARVEVSGKSLDFIQGELDRLSSEILEVEAAVAKVKSENPQRLPDDIPNNQRRLERVMSDLAFAQRGYSEARSDEAFFRSQAASAATMSSPNDVLSPITRLKQLEMLLGEYESKGFTEKHPDMIRTRAEIVVLRERVESGDVDDPAQNSFAQQSAEAEGHRASQRRAAAEEEMQRLENLGVEIQNLLAATPAVAEKLDGLERRYQHLFGSYQDFSNRRLEATVQAQLERRQLGEQFRVLEAAFVAPEPTSPNRPVLMVLSLVLAIAVAGALGIVLEATDSSVHTVRQLQNAIQLPVLASIPKIMLESDRRALRRQRIRTGLAAMTMVLFALIGGVASYVWVNGGRGSGDGESVEETEMASPPVAAEG
jgi:polysaccharide chain length determinant protein (PEP-CTERM system associated)